MCFTQFQDFDRYKSSKTASFDWNLNFIMQHDSVFHQSF